MYTIRTEQCFDSAHFLAGYVGKCSNLHGHRWRIVAEVCAEKLRGQENPRVPGDSKKTGGVHEPEQKCELGQLHESEQKCEPGQLREPEQKCEPGQLHEPEQMCEPGLLRESEQLRGMVADFGDLKRDLKELTDSFDHAFIYESDSLKEKTVLALREEGFRLIEVPFRPTAENFARYFFDCMKQRGYCMTRMEVYETPNNCAVYSETRP